jgi:hypothetical protein
MKDKQCTLIKLPKILDVRGNLTFIEGNKHIPFDIKRVFYLYDVPGGEKRAGHALKTCDQFIIAAAGSFNVHLDDGTNKSTYHLNRSYYGLYVPAMVWREIDDFSSCSVCLVLASEEYSEEGYYREYDDFIKVVRA